MECISLYITPSIQEFLTKNFIIKAKLLQHNILHLRFLLEYVFPNVTKNIIQQFIDYYFSDAVKKAFNIIGGGRQLGFGVRMLNKKMMPYDENYLLFIRILTKKYQYTYQHSGKMILDDGNDNRLSIISHKQNLQKHNNLLKYFTKGDIMWVELNNDNVQSFLS